MTLIPFSTFLTGISFSSVSDVPFCTINLKLGGLFKTPESKFIEPPETESYLMPAKALSFLAKDAFVMSVVPLLLILKLAPLPA